MSADVPPVRYRRSLPYLAAFSSLLLAVALPERPGVVLLVLAGLAPLAVLLAGARSFDSPRRFAGALVGFAFPLAGVAGLGLEAGWGLPAAALALVLVAVLLGYGLHRYELVRLGLAGGTDER